MKQHTSLQLSFVNLQLQIAYIIEATTLGSTTLPTIDKILTICVIQAGVLRVPKYACAYKYHELSKPLAHRSTVARIISGRSGASLTIWNVEWKVVWAF